MRRIGRIVQYTDFDKISSLVTNDIQKRIGIENVEELGYGLGAYAKAPLIVVTKNRERYKYSVNGNVYILKGKRWIKVGKWL